jgi:Icc-related predicted phosphoesterase
MKIQVVSDLHLEFEDIHIKNELGADVLVLSGDICVTQDLHDHPPVHPMDPTVIPNLGRRQAAAQRYRDFFKRCSFQFPHVIYIMGNHEHYHGKFDLSASYIQDSLNSMGLDNVYLLDKGTKQIDDVTFIGGTMWTDCNKADSLTLYHLEHSMNDFRLIRVAKENFRKFLPSRTVSEHRRTLEYFKSVMLGLPQDAKVVVCSHHAPSHLSIHEQYKTDHLMNGGYASDLSEYILDHERIKLWTHGHMHQCFDYTIGNTRVVCNPRGYNDENPDFNPNFIIEI